MAVNKQSFYESINQDSIFNDNYFKKVYGYSVYDNEFEEQVIFLLDILGLEKAIQGYKAWKQQYEDKCNRELVKVAHWYRKWLDDRQEREVRARSGGKKPREGNIFRGFSQA